jgi:hypothetical protein
MCERGATGVQHSCRPRHKLNCPCSFALTHPCTPSLSTHPTPSPKTHTQRHTDVHSHTQSHTPPHLSCSVLASSPSPYSQSSASISAAENSSRCAMLLTACSSSLLSSCVCGVGWGGVGWGGVGAMGSGDKRKGKCWWVGGEGFKGLSGGRWLGERREGLRG